MSRVLAVLVALCALLSPSWAQAQGRLNARVAARALLGVEPSTGSHVGSCEFLQRDPSGFVDSVNVYAAMANDPINHRDPTGRLRTQHLTPSQRGVLYEAISLIRGRKMGICSRHFRANEASLDLLLTEGFGPIVRVVPNDDEYVIRKKERDGVDVGGYFAETKDENAIYIVERMLVSRRNRSDLYLLPPYSLANTIVHELEHLSEYAARGEVTGDTSLWKTAEGKSAPIGQSERAATNCVELREPLE